MTLSLCMIVRNEFGVLSRCLASISPVVDEIIIVDTGSTDNTKEIASSFGAKVYDFVWCDDFSAARNFALSKATMDYWMWMDADDVLPESQISAFLELKQQLSFEIDIVMMKYETAFDEQGNPLFSFYRERILKRARNDRWEGPVHEVITPSGNIIYRPISIQHKKPPMPYTKRNLNIYEKWIQEGHSLDARHEFYYARELYYHQRYEEAIQRFENFLTKTDGWYVNQLEACRFLSLCYQKQNDETKAVQSLFRSFAYDIPGAEIFCDLGAWFFRHKKFRQAIFWYLQALQSPKEETDGKFVLNECYGYLPCIWLCVCYDRLGEYKTAALYNERAGSYKPYGKEYQKNKTYFETVHHLSEYKE